MRAAWANEQRTEFTIVLEDGEEYAGLTGPLTETMPCDENPLYAQLEEDKLIEPPGTDIATA